MMAQTKAENYWFRYLCWYARGRRKENCFKNLSTTIEMILGDSENMPEDNYFDANCCRYNFETLEKVC
jgi:demethylmenaquinone methyltransferase/2-methoxy-6-polyprenyl-1,4-benzoquinol methylase